MAAALDGFLAQTVPAAAIELLLIEPAGSRVSIEARHRRLPIRRVAWPRGGYHAAAISAGARAARGSVVAVIDPQWRPLPGLVDYGLAFHAREIGAGDLLSLMPAIDPEVADDPLLWWLAEQQLAGLGTLTPGIHNWRAVRFDAFSAKRDFLRARPVPAGEGDEVLMRQLWAQRAPIRVFVEPVPVMVTAGRPALELVMDRQHRGAYARFKAMRAWPQAFAGEPVDDRFQHPERYVLPAADLIELAETLAALEHELAGRHPRFAVGADAERFELLGKLYMAAVSHARSTGWADAKAGRRRRRSTGYP